MSILFLKCLVALVRFVYLIEGVKLIGRERYERYDGQQLNTIFVRETLSTRRGLWKE